MFIPVKITSKVTGRVVNTSVSPRFLLDRCDEQDLMQELTLCECQPIGETNIVECRCEDEWDYYELLIGDEVTKSEEGTS